MNGMRRQVLDISCFGLMSSFIIRFSDGSKKRVDFSTPQRHKAVKRLIAMGGFKRVMSIGAYDLYERPSTR